MGLCVSFFLGGNQEDEKEILLLGRGYEPSRGQIPKEIVAQ